MSINTLLHELWRFVKDSWIKILIGSFVFGLIGWGAYQAIDYLFASEEDQTEALETLTTIYAQEPAEFQAVVMTKEGDVFANSYIFDEYFTRPAVLEKIEKETGVDLTKWQAAELALNLNKTPQFRGGIAAIRNTSSNVITFRFLVADTASDNLKVAQAYAELLETGGVPFTQNQTVHIITQPATIELLDLERNKEVPTEDTLSAYVSNNPILPVLAFFAGALLGVFITIVLLLFSRLFQSTITYAFDYSWDFLDYHQIIIDDSLKVTIETPSVFSRLVVSQNKMMNIENQITSLEQMPSLDYQLDEIVLLINASQTTKEWYRRQYDMAQLLNVKIRIVHVI